MQWLVRQFERSGADKSRGRLLLYDSSIEKQKLSKLSMYIIKSAKLAVLLRLFVALPFLTSSTLTCIE